MERRAAYPFPREQAEIKVSFVVDHGASDLGVVESIHLAYNVVDLVFQRLIRFEFIILRPTGKIL